MSEVIQDPAYWRDLPAILPLMVPGCKYVESLPAMRAIYRRRTELQLLALEDPALVPHVESFLGRFYHVVWTQWRGHFHCNLAPAVYASFQQMLPALFTEVKAELGNVLDAWSLCLYQCYPHIPFLHQRPPESLSRQGRYYYPFGFDRGQSKNAGSALFSIAIASYVDKRYAAALFSLFCARRLLVWDSAHTNHWEEADFSSPQSNLLIHLWHWHLFWTELRVNHQLPSVKLLASCRESWPKEMTEDLIGTNDLLDW